MCKLKTPGGRDVVQILAWDSSCGEVAAIVHDSRCSARYGFSIGLFHEEDLKPDDPKMTAREALENSIITVTIDKNTAIAYGTPEGSPSE